MDILATLRSGIEGLPQGSHSAGLRSVLVHIEAAYRHLARGEGSAPDQDADETAFTDAIYRCNQAFEGGVKEAYRVLAGEDPARKTPFEIEKHLEQKNIFKDRVLYLFTTYRQQWRNPSTHDYTLVFDSSEAFLAIINISGFTKVLIDQISNNLINKAAKNSASINKVSLPEEASDWNLLSKTAYFSKLFAESSGKKYDRVQEYSLELARYLSVNVEGSIVEIEPQLEGDKRYRPDLILRKAREALIIEVIKRGTETAVDNGLLKLESYMNTLRTNASLILCMPQIDSELEFYEFDLDLNAIALGVLPKSDTYISSPLPVDVPIPR